MLRDSVGRTRPRAILLAMITMRKSTHGFPFVSHIWVAYGVLLGGPLGRRSSAIENNNHTLINYDASLETLSTIYSNIIFG